MNRLILTALIPSLAMIQPAQAAEQILSKMERCGTANLKQLIQHTLCPSGSFNASEARQFLL